MFHGRGGPVNVKRVERPNALNFAFMGALKSLQFPACPDFNGPDSEGYGLRQGTIRDGPRVTTARPMLSPALARPGQFPDGAWVTKVMVADGRGAGVVLADGRMVGARPRWCSPPAPCSPRSC